MNGYTDETIADINKVLPPFVQLTEQSPPADLWAALFRLYGEQVQGPKGHATWKDAALAELLLRTRGVRDIHLPDGAVRRNVGSDNLSDEDRAAMALTNEQVQALNDDQARNGIYGADLPPVECLYPACGCNSNICRDGYPDPDCVRKDGNA